MSIRKLPFPMETSEVEISVLLMVVGVWFLASGPQGVRRAEWREEKGKEMAGHH